MGYVYGASADDSDGSQPYSSIANAIDRDFFTAASAVLTQYESCVMEITLASEVQADRLRLKCSVQGTGFVSWTVLAYGDVPFWGQTGSGSIDTEYEFGATYGVKRWKISHMCETPGTPMVAYYEGAVWEIEANIPAARHHWRQQAIQ